MITQTAPHIITGTLSEIPDPSTIPDGYLFYAVDVQELFVLVINQTTQLRAWEISSSSTTIPLHRGLLVGSGSYPAGVNLLFVQTNGVGTTVTLPNVNSVIDGEVLYLKDLTSAAAITLAVPAGNTLEGVLNGTQVLAGGGGDQAAMLVADKTTGGWWILSESLTGPNMPLNPQYFVSNTGSDTNPGTQALPLATIEEAFRRLDVSKWTGQAIVTVVDALPTEANPTWNVPEPVGGAAPVLLQGTLVDSGLGSLVPTGGTTPTLKPTTLASITTSLTPATNQYKGELAHFTGGALSGVWRVIDSNTNTGTFRICGDIAAAPQATTPLSIMRRAGKYSFTGTLTINGKGNVLLIDALEIDLGLTTRLSSVTIQSTRCKFIGSNAGSRGLGSGFIGTNFVLNDGNTQQSPTFPPPYSAGGLIPSGCGSRWQGVGTGLDGVIVLFCDVGDGDGESHFNGKAIISSSSLELVEILLTEYPNIAAQTAAIEMCWWTSLTTGSIGMQGGCIGCDRVLLTGCRVSPASGVAAAIECLAGTIELSDTTMNNTLAGSDLISLGMTSARMLSVMGANPAAGKPVTISDGGLLTQTYDGFSQSNSVTGGAPGSDIWIDSNPAFAWADLTSLGGTVRSGDHGGVLHFGGGMTQGAGATTAYLGSALPGATANSAAALRTPLSPARRALHLRVKPTQNSMTTATTVTLMKNGVATSVTVSIPSTSTALVSDVTHGVVFQDGDDYDLQVTNPNATNGNTIQLVATLEIV